MRCPTCGKLVPAADSTGAPPPKPFCSVPCRQIDLGNWLDGEYRIPGPPVDPEQFVDHEGER